MSSKLVRRPAASRLIVALDLPDLASALRMARRGRGVAETVKIGSALFTAEGPEAIRRLRALGFEVFLDLKFHDIPSTVAKSCRAAVAHRVRMLTVHASGQSEMLAAAAEGVREEAAKRGVPRPLVVGVTVLTSVEAEGAARLALALAAAAKRAGLDGVVASAHEVSAIRRRLGKTFGIVCPGIRLGAGHREDQRRVASPREAIARGADWLVVGRPITEATDPRGSAQAILKDIEEANRSKRNV